MSAGWGAWGRCSRTCGGGTKTRTRSVIAPGQALTAALLAADKRAQCPELQRTQPCGTARTAALVGAQGVAAAGSLPRPRSDGGDRYIGGGSP